MSLYQAAENGDFKLLKTIVRKHTRLFKAVNAKNKNGKTPLHLASSNGHLLTVKQFLKFRADIDALTSNGKTALYLSVSNNQLEVVKFLISNNAKVDHTACKDWTPLHEAARNGNDEIMSLLIENGANIEALTMHLKTPLHLAISSKKLSAVKYLIGKGANILAKDKNGCSTINAAIINGSFDILKFLHQIKPELISITDKYGLTPLHVSAKLGLVDHVKFLIENSANMEALTTDSLQTPLHFAMYSKNLLVVKHLVEKGANINAIDKRQIYPIHVVALAENVEILNYLFEKDPDHFKSNSVSVLQLSVHRCLIKNIEFLISKGVDIEGATYSPTYLSVKAIHKAAKYGNVEVLTCLLKHGANINSTTHDLYTALHLSVIAEKIDNVKCLLENNIETKAYDSGQKTAAHYAAGLKSPDILNVLLLHDPLMKDMKDKDGWTALHIAVEKDLLENVKCFVEHDANINAETRANWTPLHLAAYHGKSEILDYLLKSGSNVNIRTCKLRTALHCSIFSGNINVVTSLINFKTNI